MEDKKLNLYQKLIQVRKEVVYLQKSAAGFNFKYATEGQLLASIRPKMDELGVFLEMDMISLTAVECTFMKDKQQVAVNGLKAEFEFKWVNAENPNETIVKKLILQEQESCIETVGSLMTYANRYFLYKFFSVATDKDDPDTFENKNKKKENVPTARESRKVETISPEEAQEIENMLIDFPEQRKNMLIYFTNQTKSEKPLENFFSFTKTMYEACKNVIQKNIDKRKSDKTEEEIPF